MGTRIDVGGVWLNVDQSGSGFPVIMFLHGITANRRVWDPVIALLSHRFTCISVDQRGHGLSDKPSFGYKDADFGNDIRELAKKFSPTAGVYLVGHSLGARNSIVAATEFPELVRGVIALDFVPFIEDTVLDALEERVVQGNQSFSSREEVENYLTRRYPNLPGDAIARRTEFGFHKQRSGSFVPLASARAMLETMRGLRADLEPFLSNVMVPTVIVRGEKSLLVSPEAFAKAIRVNPRVASEIVPGADHYIPEEAPEAVAQLVESYCY